MPLHGTLKTGYNSNIYILPQLIKSIAQMLWELRGKASVPPKRVLMPGAKPSRVLTKITWGRGAYEINERWRKTRRKMSSSVFRVKGRLEALPEQASSFCTAISNLLLCLGHHLHFNGDPRTPQLSRESPGRTELLNYMSCFQIMGCGFFPPFLKSKFHYCQFQSALNHTMISNIPTVPKGWKH